MSRRRAPGAKVARLSALLAASDIGDLASTRIADGMGQGIRVMTAAPIYRSRHTVEWPP
ncbi:MAG: hypothetical protein ACLQIK_05390 [Mycobacterium sp.]|uniref:hypothetical protein n=1 Tax=Mycobacterium sp. TaxID=1785 RepID=UPI003F969297